MSTKLITFTHRVAGVLTDATSVKLSDPTAAYGLRRVSNSSIVVADDVSLTHDSTGVYSYTVTGLTAGVEYEYWIEWVYGGATKRVDRTFTAADAAVTVPGLPVATLRTAAELAAGGQGKIPSGGSLDLILATAVDRLCGFHNWQWMLGTGTLDLAADTTYVTLPNDFGHLLAVDGNATNRYHLVPLTMDRILRLRAEAPQALTTGVGQVFFYALDTTTQASSSVPSRWRLELYPTPSATEAAALSLSYRRRIALPAAASGDSAVVDVPVQATSALLALVRAEAALVSPDDKATKKYPVYESAAQAQLGLLKERDALMAPPGRMRGTVIEIAERDDAPGGRFYTSVPVTIN